MSSQVSCKISNYSILKQAESTKNIYCAIFVALIGTSFFVFPLLPTILKGYGHFPGYMMTGDIKMLWFPQFLQSCQRLQFSNIFGVDLLTGGGASEISLRANLLPIYPPFILSFLLINCHEVGSAIVAFNFLHICHMFAGFFFCYLLAVDYFKFRMGEATLLSGAYLLSYQIGNYIPFTPFYFQIVLTPILAYTICWLNDKGSLISAILCSIVFLTYLLTSYGPTMVAGFFVSLAVVLLIEIANNVPINWQSLIKWRLNLVALLIALLIAGPYYISQGYYFKTVSGSPKDLGFVAHGASLSGRAIFDAFSASIIGNPPVEGRIYWGLGPIIIIILGLVVSAFNSDEIDDRLRSIFYCSLGIFILSVFITMGSDTIASDIFYYATPVLGKMHLYQRYLMFTQFFMAIAIASATSIVITYATRYQRGVTTILVLFLWVAATIFVSTSSLIKAYADPSKLLPELLFGVICIIPLLISKTQFAIIIAAIGVILPSLGSYYDLQRSGSKVDSDKVYLSHATNNDAFDQVAKINSKNGKELIKVLNIGDEIDSYIPHNIGWMSLSKKNITTYHSYELHLALDKDYLQMMGGWFGKYNREWVLQSGLDYVVWNANSQNKLSNLSIDTISLGEPRNIGGGNYLSEVIYRQEIDASETFNLISLLDNKPELWSIVTSNKGWIQEYGRMKLSANAPDNAFAVPIPHLAGKKYEVTLDIAGSHRGSLNVAFGGNYAQPIDTINSGSHKRYYIGDGLSALWISATPDFDGHVTNIIVKRMPDEGVEKLKNVFDNGILRLESEGTDSTITNFKTDMSNNITANLISAGPSRIVYLLWQINSLNPYIDGQIVNWKKHGAISYVDIPPGDHLFEIRYSNKWVYIILLMVKIYLFLMAVIMIKQFWHMSIGCFSRK